MNRPLRVLVVLPLYGGSLPIGRYCARALAGLGHVAETFEAPDFFGAFSALKNLRVTTERLDYLEHAFLQVVAQAIMSKAETFQPDLVLAMAQAPLTRQVLKRLRQAGIPSVMWFVEDFRLFTYWESYAAQYDAFAVIQKEPLLSKLGEVGQKNGLYLPLAADPEFHKPLELTSAEKRVFGADVAFLGAGYPNRRAAFKELMGTGLKIWGSDWEGDEVLAQLVQRGGERISSEDSVKIFNATSVNLNLHSSVSAKELVSGGDFVNPRTFELAMCGAFQLVDERTLLPELFAPDELATFTSMEGLKDGVRRFLAAPEEREAYARRARERALKEHTYQARMKTLLAFLEERLDGWPAPREGQGALAALPEAYREEARGLLAGLGLTEDAPFKDLVWALRAKAGKLTPVETAILFLDEWQKQYGARAE
ncbi:CgeB family protein [Fundidesulfovibrio terrae]|uniref:CgeB family protein n=1 Tax=Fundidesulfovibrio terrae TaxID=2922866 RepID=UPI001FAF5F98|nr:glycosyltransferase [Fundidesulfovibrio terrae]